MRHGEALGGVLALRHCMYLVNYWWVNLPTQPEQINQPFGTRPSLVLQEKALLSWLLPLRLMLQAFQRHLSVHGKQFLAARVSGQKPLKLHFISRQFPIVPELQFALLPEGRKWSYPHGNCVHIFKHEDMLSVATYPVIQTDKTIYMFRK